MRIDPTRSRKIALSGAVVLMALGLAMAAAILVMAEPPKWLALGGLASLAAALAVMGWTLRRGAGADYRFRVLREHCAITLRPDARAPEGGETRARGRVRTETLYQSLAQGQTHIRLQKFFAEPTATEADALLRDWQYACRVTAQDGKGAMEVPAPPAWISDSRSLQVDVALPQPLRRGETFALEEELDFVGDVGKEGGAYAFQASYPTRRRTVEILFEGLRPVEPGFRIGRGQAVVGEGAIPVEDRGEGRFRIAFVWNDPAVGDELSLRWSWDPALLAAPQSEADRLIAEALADRAAPQQAPQPPATGPGSAPGSGPESAPESAPGSGPESAPAGAEEHPLIKAARTREARYRGGGD